MWHNASGLVFADYWQQKIEEDYFNKVKHMLGIRWTREDADALHQADEGGKPSKPTTVVEWPLATILEPALQDSIKKVFGRKFGIDAPKWAKRAEEIVELYEQPRNDFLNFVQNFVRPKVVTG